jgi:hypothetical protein
MVELLESVTLPGKVKLAQKGETRAVRYSESKSLLDA